MAFESFSLSGFDIKQPKPGSVADAQMSATADWSPMGDIYMKKSTIYEMSWPKGLIEIGSSLVAIAPYGGPIAIMRDESKVSVDAQQRLARPNIFIYTSSGILLAEIPWSGGRVSALGWTNTEKLIVVLEEGSIAKYDIHGNYLHQSALPNEVRSTGVYSVKFFHLLTGTCGLGLLTRNWKFYSASDLDGTIRVRRMAEIPDVYDSPSCWTIIPAGFNSASIFAAYGDKIYKIDHITCKEMDVPDKREKRENTTIPWVNMAVAPNGNLLALIDEKGYMWLGTSDFKATHVEYDTKCAEKVDHFEWCASQAVVVTWGKIMFVKGRDKTWIKYPLSSAYPCAMVADIDGIRIISKYFCEFLQKVPTATVGVLRIGSLEPGAMLNDALKEFEGEESHKADEYIRYIKDKMPDAILQCTEAAGAEFEASLQKSLLRSGQFGKCFLGSDIPQNIVDNFVEMCQHLRVLNVIRDYRIGIPLTYRQLLRLTPTVLIDRLIYRKKYAMAQKICESLRLPPKEGEEKIIKQWALDKVKEKGSDGEILANVIVKKFQSCSCSVSFADIAKQAIANKKPALAVLLLDYEVSPTRQVPLLLEMMKYESALDKAITSGDPELVNKVIWHIKQDLPLREFMMIFHKRPVAAALYKKYCRENDHQTLLRLCEQESNNNEIGNIQFDDSFAEKSVEGRLELLRQAIKRYRDAQNYFALKCAEEQYKLLELQKRLESKLEVRLVGLSVIETGYQLMLKNQVKMVDQLRKDFKISDTQFWWIRIKALAERRDWNELEKFSKSKKSPIGYEPFVEVCIQKNSKNEALKYVMKLPLNQRWYIYMKIGELEKAAEAAFQDRNSAALDQVLAKCGHRREIADKVQMLKSQLGSK